MADIDYEYAHGVACIELAKAKAEIERLKTALRAIDLLPGRTPLGKAQIIAHEALVARAALEGK